MNGVIATVTVLLILSLYLLYKSLDSDEAWGLKLLAGLLVFMAGWIAGTAHHNGNWLW